MKQTYLITFYLAAFIAANLLVKELGAPGLWASSFLLIPFDFVCRCFFHETWSKKSLVLRLFLLTCASAWLTVVINANATQIANASILGFIAAQIGAGIFYQSFKRRSFFVKVNGSDLIAIIFDSLVFQAVAFGGYDWKITAGQIIVKFAGGLLWYYIIFKKIKLHEKIIVR